MKKLILILFLCVCFVMPTLATPITVLNHSFEFVGGVDQSEKQTCVVPDDWAFGSGSTCEVLEAVASEGELSVAIYNVDSVYQLTGHTIAEEDYFELNFDAYFLWSLDIWDVTFEGRLYYDDGGSRTVIDSVQYNFSTGMPDWTWHNITAPALIPAASPAIGKQLGIELAVVNNGGASGSWFGFDNVSLELLDPPRTKPATFYIDSITGDDGNTGLTTNDAWATLANVNALDLIPGDQVLFKADTSYTGQLTLEGAGTSANPIVVDMYGTGAKPIIQGLGVVGSTVYMYNVSYFELRNLEISNQGAQSAADRKGVYVHLNNFGTAYNVKLLDLYIHDVNGSNVKEAGNDSGGIFYRNEGAAILSRFDGLLIENCHLVRCDRNGINGWGYTGRDNWYPNLNVVIRGNLLEDIGGDGIVPIACDGALVEYNTVDRARQRANDYAVAIWPWSCDNTLIQYNEASRTKGTDDGEGFDSDYNCTNTVIQYNYSHDNEGGFLLVCSAPPNSWNIGNIGTIVRYNISQNDGTGGDELIKFGGAIENTHIYNNTFYINDNLLRIYRYRPWDDVYPNDTRVENNIFYTAPGATSQFDVGLGETNSVYSHNIMYGAHNLNTKPYDPYEITSDPMLVNPGSGGDGIDTVDGYMLLSGSPAIDSGKEIADNGGIDYWSNPVPDGITDRGVHETSNVPPVCDDGTCDPGEDQCNCPEDCGTPPSTETGYCTDGIDNDCDTYTDCDDSDCDSDFACTCGNGVCDIGEDCTTCSADCISKTTGAPSSRYCCGDGECTGAENETNCAVDCGSGSYCGDETCDPGEDQCNCPEDCGTPPSTETSCTDSDDNDCDTDVDCDDSDCIGDPACPSCGDETCDSGEDQCNCPEDCGTPPSTETDCDDGIDNDCGGGTDCDDSDCEGDPACPDCVEKGGACTDNADCCSGTCLPAGKCK